MLHNYIDFENCISWEYVQRPLKFSFAKKATKICAILLIYLRRNGANFCGLLRKAELYCPNIYIVFSMHSPSLQGSFQFSYSRGHGVCNYPKSSISQCSDASKLVFRYQVCNFLLSLFFSLLLIWNWCWTFEIWIEFSFVLEFVCFF